MKKKKTKKKKVSVTNSRQNERGHEWNRVTLSSGSSKFPRKGEPP